MAPPLDASDRILSVSMLQESMLQELYTAHPIAAAEQCSYRTVQRIR